MIYDFEPEKLQLTFECLITFRSYMQMIFKFPIKKADKLKGQKFIAVIDDLISYFESKGIKSV